MKIPTKYKKADTWGQFSPIICNSAKGVRPLVLGKMLYSSGLGSTHFRKGLRFEWVQNHSFSSFSGFRVGFHPLIFGKIAVSSGPSSTRSDYNRYFEWALIHEKKIIPSFAFIRS